MAKAADRKDELIISALISNPTVRAAATLARLRSVYRNLTTL